LSVSETLKILYAPRKAFKEITKQQKVAGLILVAILFVGAYTAYSYVFSTKIYDEQTIPNAAKLDEWTENTTLWTSNANIALSNDYVDGTLYGNNSVEFSVTNQSQIWAQIAGIGPVNCTGTEGYKNVSIRVKTLNPLSIPLFNVTLYMFSNQTDYFHYDIPVGLLISNVTRWSNLTIPLGPGAGWINNSLNADWSHINRLKFEFVWPETSNFTVRLDGLFFRGVYKPFLTDPTNYVLLSLSSGFMKFVFNWIILAGVVYAMIRLSGGKLAWKPVLLLIALCLITYFVEWMVNTVTFSTLPTIYRSIDLFGPVGERELAIQRLSEQIGFERQMVLYVTQLIMMIWNIILLIFASKALSEMSWFKCASVALVAYFLNFLAQGFISVLFGV
jgi:hypothetical protein